MSSRLDNYVTSSESLDENNPLWAYVATIEDRPTGGGGGNKKWSCNFCQMTFTGSYSRVKAHLLKLSGHGVRVCSKVMAEYLNELNRVSKVADERSKPKEVPLPPTSLNSGGSKKRRLGSLETSFNLESRENLKSDIARMFYSAGLPFHFARNPYYISSYTYAANNQISGFIPPGYNTLRTTLLQKERAHIERLLQSIKSAWTEKGVSIVTDGWTDPQRRPLINFMAASEGGPIFLKAIDGSNEYKDKHYIAGLISNTISEVGPHNVVQVITDNAPVCKAAGMLIEIDYPRIFWTPCVVHTLNLALKNIWAAKNSQRNEVIYSECNWITQVSDDASFIKVFIMNHSMRLAMFNEFVPLKLLAVAETRFASVIVMLRRFKLIKRGLQNLVISERWISYREDDVGKASTVKQMILNYLWWDKVDYIIEFTKPIYEMLRRCDADQPTLHLVYDMWDTMIQQVKKEIFKHERRGEHQGSSFYDVVYSILIDRWTKNCTPLHCMAHSLNPRYYSLEWLEGGEYRLAPHRDTEISEERNKCFRRYFPNSEERTNANLEFARFSGCLDIFSSFDSMHDRGSLDPKSWWLVHGASIPLLQSLALKLLGQPSSSSCAERNWSTYSFIHSMRRNKINPKRAEDLVYVHTNLRLLSRRCEKYNLGETKMWDIGVMNGIHLKVPECSRLQVYPLMNRRLKLYFLPMTAMVEMRSTQFLCRCARSDSI